MLYSIFNLPVEGSVLCMQEMGNIEPRGLAISILGTVIIFFAFFSIPVRRWWALVVSGVFLLYEIGAFLALVLVG